MQRFTDLRYIKLYKFAYFRDLNVNKPVNTLSPWMCFPLMDNEVCFLLFFLFHSIFSLIVFFAPLDGAGLSFPNARFLHSHRNAGLLPQRSSSDFYQHLPLPSVFGPFADLDYLKGKSAQMLWHWRGVKPLLSVLFCSHQRENIESGWRSWSHCFQRSITASPWCCNYRSCSIMRLTCEPCGSDLPSFLSAC